MNSNSYLVKKYKILYDILMYSLVGVITAYLYYRFMIFLNVKNDYHVNKDIWIFNIFAGIVGTILRRVYLEWNSEDTTIEDEMRHYMINETNQFISQIQNNRKKELYDFKFFRGQHKPLHKGNGTNSLGPR